MRLVENQPPFEAEVEPAGRSGGVSLPRRIHTRSGVHGILDAFAVPTCSQRPPTNDSDLKQNLFQVVFSKGRPNRVGHLLGAFVFCNALFDSFQHLLQVERFGATLATLLARNRISFVPPLQLIPFADKLLQRFSAALLHLFAAKRPKSSRSFSVTDTRSFLRWCGVTQDNARTQTPTPVPTRVCRRPSRFAIILRASAAGNVSHSLDRSGSAGRSI